MSLMVRSVVTWETLTRRGAVGGTKPWGEIFRLPLPHHWFILYCNIQCIWLYATYILSSLYSLPATFIAHALYHISHTYILTALFDHNQGTPDLMDGLSIPLIQVEEWSPLWCDWNSTNGVGLTPLSSWFWRPDSFRQLYTIPIETTQPARAWGPRFNGARKNYRLLSGSWSWHISATMISDSLWQRPRRRLPFALLISAFCSWAHQYGPHMIAPRSTCQTFCDLWWAASCIQEKWRSVFMTDDPRGLTFRSWINYVSSNYVSWINYLCIMICGCCPKFSKRILTLFSYLSRWWFQQFSHLDPTWGDDPFWLTFFKKIVATT